MTRLGLGIALALVGPSCGKADAPAVSGGSASGEGAAAPYVQVAHDALVGRPAPAVTLDLLDGTRVDLATLIGRTPIYLKFWATWCVPCREQMPHLEATYRDHGHDLAVFAVDVAMNDPIENVRAFVAAQHLTVPVAIDRTGTVAEAFELNVTPQHVVIDRAGVVRYVGHAVTPELERALAEVIGSSTGARPPPTAPAATGLPPLALDDGTSFDYTTRPRAPIALTFATLFCDSYIANTRPEIGATCAAHAHHVEEVHRAHPGLTWLVVAFPVWTAADETRDFHTRLGVTVPVGVDHGNAWFRRFHVRDTYTTILFDAAGGELGRVGGDGAPLAALIAKAK